MSLALSPLSSNVLISESREALKLGRLVSARARLAVVESLLPSFTDHEGPPTISDASRAATERLLARLMHHNPERNSRGSGDGGGKLPCDVRGILQSEWRF
ncbi:hypothetical protein Ccrd_000416 [Cynara cardunculus var. scolymus]|uniref:Uncharacterized protein n=1 Tax=Cynara cardunculus var. scolymus TaxID=59895 RepID=A0A118JXS9_CYNCS|nr:hypothetical protein Ccrd_000416 [Cynara cardunculus var. scolymus]